MRQFILLMVLLDWCINKRIKISRHSIQKNFKDFNLNSYLKYLQDSSFSVSGQSAGRSAGQSAGKEAGGYSGSIEGSKIGQRQGGLVGLELEQARGIKDANLLRYCGIFGGIAGYAKGKQIGESSGGLAGSNAGAIAGYDVGMKAQSQTAAMVLGSEAGKIVGLNAGFKAGSEKVNQSSSQISIDIKNFTYQAAFRYLISNNLELPDSQLFPYEPMDERSFTGLIAGYQAGAISAQKQAIDTALELIQRLGGEIGRDVALKYNKSKTLDQVRQITIISQCIQMGRDGAKFLVVDSWSDIGYLVGGYEGALAGQEASTKANSIEQAEQNGTTQGLAQGVTVGTISGSIQGRLAIYNSTQNATELIISYAKQTCLIEGWQGQYAVTPDQIRQEATDAGRNAGADAGQIQGESIGEQEGQKAGEKAARELAENMTSGKGWPAKKVKQIIDAAVEVGKTGGAKFGRDAGAFIGRQVGSEYGSLAGSKVAEGLTSLSAANILGAKAGANEGKKQGKISGEEVGQTEGINAGKKLGLEEVKKKIKEYNLKL